MKIRASPEPEPELGGEGAADGGDGDGKCGGRGGQAGAPRRGGEKMSFKTTGDKDTAKAGTPRKKRDRAKPTTTTTTKNGTGRKDPSYIPRAPNAFILFRSSFIRSQRVPGDVEGRNASLSKIVGESRSWFAFRSGLGLGLAVLEFCPLLLWVCFVVLVGLLWGLVGVALCWRLADYSHNSQFASCGPSSVIGSCRVRGASSAPHASIPPSISTSLSFPFLPLFAILTTLPSRSLLERPPPHRARPLGRKSHARTGGT